MTENEPAEPFTVPPVVAVPSPQLMVAVKSEDGETRSVSVKVATVTLVSAWLLTALMVVPCGVSASCSPTTTLPVAVAVAWSDARVIVTLRGSLPSSA